MNKPDFFNRRWLAVGIGVKRWLAVMVLGMTLSALGLAQLLGEIRAAPGSPLAYLTLQFLDPLPRGLALDALGIGLMALGLLRLNRALLAAVLPPRSRPVDLADNLWARRRGQRGPRVVALGGGHGLSTLLSGLKLYTDHITAIVSVADDGGSSGRIRRDFGILPPGDIRRCLAALAEAEPLVTQLFEYRFNTGEGLEGHTFGNLFITALAEVTGSFEEAVRETNRVLAVRGQIVPATLTDVTLWAELEGVNGAAGEHISGESQIAKGGARISRVYLQPHDPPAARAALAAIRDADLVIVGPGSLYTSLLSTLLIGEISQAIRSSDALRVYVCNVATEPGETDHFGVQAHINALIEHVGPGLFDLALANSNDRPSHKFAPEWQGKTSIVPLDARQAAGLPIVTADVINPDNPLRHDPAKLARELMRLLERDQDQSSAGSRQSPGADRTG